MFEIALVGMFIGFAFGLLTAHVVRLLSGPAKQTIAMMAAVFVSFAVTSVTQAQSVTLNIPVDTIFSSTNNWLQVFAPIGAIGIGITLAIGIVTYIGRMIGSALGGGRR